VKKIFFVLFVIQAVLILSFAFTPSFASAITLYNPLGSLREPGPVVEKAVQGFAALIGAVAIAFMVFSGFKLVIARGDEQAVEKAKGGLQWAVGGFVVALLAFVIISGTAQFLGFSPPDEGSDELTSPLGEGDDFQTVLIGIMSRFLEITGVATILFVIYYGFRYVISRGNEEAVEKAKKGLQWSLVGFAVSLLSYTIISTIQRVISTDAP